MIRAEDQAHHLLHGSATPSLADSIDWSQHWDNCFLGGRGRPQGRQLGASDLRLVLHHDGMHLGLQEAMKPRERELPWAPDAPPSLLPESLSNDSGLSSVGPGGGGVVQRLVAGESATGSA